MNAESNAHLGLGIEEKSNAGNINIPLSRNIPTTSNTPPKAQITYIHMQYIVFNNMCIAY